ncbi:MAG: hypothetical protein IKR12_02085 [Clostridia bacterium]|nr:hypothetical protein [Clostridia bacterium]
MIQVSNEELSKISQFLASCDSMANGKFILADVKITKILNMIASSEELYRYISECMTGFDFVREYHRAEVKNGLNGGVFAVPQEPKKLVAFVFCLLVECDAKRLDFYSFINENFRIASNTDAYQNFANNLLVPFKDTIAMHFGLEGQGVEAVETMTENYRADLQQNPVFENQSASYDDSFEGNDKQVNENQTTLFDNLNTANNLYGNIDEQEAPVSNFQSAMQESIKKNDVWADIADICANVESSVYAERHVKDYLREELLYILKTIKYSTKYRDVKIISALITAFDELTKKFRSIQFVFGELKNKIQQLY